jgi:hypothetical protein
MILALQQDLKINGVDVLKNWKNQMDTIYL